MKNENISIHDIVPKHIRRATYKKAIKLIEDNQHIAMLSSFGLCLMLPCILWDLKSFLQETPQGNCWDSYDTKNMFPELTQKRTHSIGRIYDEDGSYSTELRNKKRIEVLTEMLAEL